MKVALAGVVAGGSGQMFALSPPAVAVHDYGDVPRNSGLNWFDP
jgi:hypothetical protein